MLVGANFLSSCADSQYSESHTFGLDFGYADGVQKCPLWAMPARTRLSDAPRSSDVILGKNSFAGRRCTKVYLFDRPAVDSSPIVLDTIFANLKRLGIHVVRWMILAGGQALRGSAPHLKPQLNGDYEWTAPTLGSLLWDPEHPERSSPIIADMYKAFLSARRSRMLIVPVFGSFEMFQRPEQGNIQRRIVYGMPIMALWRAGGWYSVMNSEDSIDQFLNGYLSPMLRLSDVFRDVVYGWDLFNEPEWITGGAPASSPVMLSGNTVPFEVYTTSDGRRERRALPVMPGYSKPVATVPFERMQYFLRQGLDKINTWARSANAELFPAGTVVSFRTWPFQYPFRFSTIGFAMRRSIDEWNSRALGAMKHQFHHYGTPASGPLLDPSVDPSLFIGEMATTRVVSRDAFSSDLVRHWRPNYSGLSFGVGSRAIWDEFLAMNRRLNECARRGFHEVFLWQYTQPPDIADDGVVEWTEETTRDIQRYTESNPLPAEWGASWRR